MKVYYHHVGAKGAEDDFPKTVFTELPIKIVEENFPEYLSQREAILEDIRSNFPGGRFNCWGVPEGADYVMRNLEVGDAVLLVKTTSGNGPIPALGIIKVFWNIVMPQLSKVLWGNPRFPYIFFFETEELNLSWWEFIDHVGFRPSYNPMGRMWPIAESRLQPYGGAEGYIDFLRKNYGTTEDTTYMITRSKVKTVLDAVDDAYAVQTVNEVAKLMEEARNTEPKLTSGQPQILHSAMSSPRSEAFRLGVQNLYGGRCAVCGRRLVSPKGNPEAQSAHIYPKSRDGSDDVRNGISLCRMHHWALDEGWFTLTDELVILVRQTLPRDEEYEFIHKYERSKVAKPVDDDLAPHPIFLKAHRQLHGFE